MLILEGGGGFYYRRVTLRKIGFGLRKGLGAGKNLEFREKKPFRWGEELKLVFVAGNVTQN